MPIVIHHTMPYTWNGHPSQELPVRERLAAQLAIVLAEQQAAADARQKLEEQADALDKKIQERGPGLLGKDLQKLDDLARQITALSLKGFDLGVELSRLQQEQHDMHEMGKLNALPMFAR